MPYTYFVGLDVSKNSFQDFLIDSSQNIIFNQSYPLNYQGIKSFTKTLPFTYLINHNFTCVILNPILTKNADLEEIENILSPKKSKNFHFSSRSKSTC